MSWAVWRRRARKLASHPRPVRFLASRVLWHTGMSRLLTVALPGGQRLRFYPSSVSAALWVSPRERNDDVEFLELVLHDGDTYVDCGANVGHLAVVARSLVGARGSVTAIEANPRVFAYCVGNLRLNNFTDVLALNVALGAARGTTHIGDRRDDDQSRIADDGLEVPMRPLDDVVGADRVTLLKLDVEGYELEVLRGAARTLARTSIVYCELSASNCARFGSHPRDAERLLLDAGFVLVRRRDVRWDLVREPIYESLANTDLPATGYNLIAVRPDAIVELSSRLAPRGHVVGSAR
jgi:FkbM family methyltransferase